MEVLKGLIETDWWLTNAVLFTSTLIVTVVFIVWIILKIKRIESSLKITQKINEEFEKFDELQEKLKDKGLIDDD